MSASKGEALTLEDRESRLTPLRQQRPLQTAAQQDEEYQALRSTLRVYQECKNPDLSQSTA